MGDWECKAGASLLIPEYTKGMYHLHIVASSPQNISGYRDNSCVLLSLTTIYQGIPYDDACVLDADDGHPFITHPSYVAYGFARSSCSSEIMDYVSKGVYKSQPDAPSGMLTKIVSGITNSIHSGPWLSDFEYLSN